MHNKQTPTTHPSAAVRSNANAAAAEDQIAGGEHPRSILIIRLSAIGDVVLASGLLPALRVRYPNTTLSWLTEPATAPLLRGHPALDQLFIWDKADCKRRWQSGQKRAAITQLLKLRSQLKQADFDWVIDAQGLLKSGIWAWLSGAKRRIGLGSVEGSQYLMTEVTPRDNASVISSEYRGLMRYLGASSEFVDHCYQLSLTHFATPNPLTCQQWPSIVKQLHLNVGTDGLHRGQYLVFCPFTTRPQKHWFEHHWIALAVLLHRHYQLPCVILGGPADQHAAEAMAAKMANGVSLAGHCSLLQSSQIISEAAFLIGVDTGITHMGIMHKVPTVAIFGSTCPYQSAPNTRVLYLHKSCSPCRRRPTCAGRYDCLFDITPSMVQAALAALISTQSHRPEE